MAEITISSFKNYNILEDRNITRKVKKLTPIKASDQRERKNIIGQQSRRLNDIFPANN